MTIPSVPAGYQYTTLTLPGGGWSVNSVPYGVTPAVVTGDVLMTPLLTSSGYPVTATDDGILAYDANGDASAQYYAGVDIFDTSLDAFYGAAEFANNDEAPLAPNPGTTLFFALSIAIAPVDLSAYPHDPELGITHTTCLDTLPLGLVIDPLTSILSGTPTVRAITLGLRMRSTDRFGQSVDWLLDIVVGKVSIPDVTGLSFDAGEALLGSVYLLARTGAPDFSTSFDIDQVRSQSPAADELADPGSTVTLSLSLGDPPFVPPAGVTLTRRRNQTLRHFLLG